MDKKKKKRIIIGSVIGAIVLAIIIIMSIKGGKYELNFNTAVAQQDSIVITVTATGEIQPLYQVEVGTQVSGIVEKLYVDFNSEVKKGQLLAELDKSTLMEMINQSKANLSDAESNLNFAKQNYDRIKQLYDNKAATQASFEEASNAYVQAKNRVTTAKSNLQTAQVNLSYAKIYSPISGIVLNKAVEEGQTVASSFNTPTLFTIANDLKQMQVEANVDEADIGQVKEGQNVTFTVDAFPKDVFTGTVKQVRLEPTVTSNVVTYTVIINAPNPDEKLFPGMTANVSIVVQNEKGITIPAEALHYTLDEDTKKLLAKQNYEIAEGGPGAGGVPPQGESKGGKPDMKDTSKTKRMKGMQGMKSDKSMIWIKEGQKLRPQMVTTGLNDGANTLITNGIKEGDEVVLSIEKTQKASAKQQAAGSNPFMPGPPQRKSR
ncbi:MAG: efflux RND transporter periplasmic adaptor subunit [Bacteroidales bacterium]|nr:efflux RND transporter periplasmic adaptor subunit [Bacteroidales bacterium]